MLRSERTDESSEDSAGPEDLAEHTDSDVGFPKILETVHRSALEEIVHHVSNGRHLFLLLGRVGHVGDSLRVDHLNRFADRSLLDVRVAVVEV